MFVSSNDHPELFSPEATAKLKEDSGVPCQKCGEQMQLVHAQPDQRFTNLDVATYVCDCGEDADLFIARTE